MEDGSRWEHRTFSRRRFDADGKVLSQYVRTTAGRVIYNHAIREAIDV